MCLIAFAWSPERPQVLRLAANRDEFYDRPSAALSEWQEARGVFAGRDLQAGGTWLGLNADGRFAVLTNIRDPKQRGDLRSRGELTANYLCGQLAPQAYLEVVRERTANYGGFNLLLGDRTQLWHFNSHTGRARRLEAGVYGLGNADLDTPWPKLLRARQALQDEQHADDERLLALMADTHRPDDSQLPDTGVGLAAERLLSSIFIASATYGTRASTVMSLERTGWRIIERSFGPHGVMLGEVRLQG